MNISVEGKECEEMSEEAAAEQNSKHRKKKRRKMKHSKRGTDLGGINTENASQEDVMDLSCIKKILNVNNTATKVGFELEEKKGRC